MTYWQARCDQERGLNRDCRAEWFCLVYGWPHAALGPRRIKEFYPDGASNSEQTACSLSARWQWRSAYLRFRKHPRNLGKSVVSEAERVACASAWWHYKVRWKHKNFSCHDRKRRVIFGRRISTKTENCKWAIWEALKTDWKTCSSLSAEKTATGKGKNAALWTDGGNVGHGLRRWSRGRGAATKARHRGWLIACRGWWALRP
jgi:hypothetical protein